MTEVVEVALPERGYRVLVGHGVRRELAAVLPVDARRAVIVTQEGVGWDVDPARDHIRLTIPDGETAKRLEVIEKLCSQMAAAGVTRGDVLVAVGGGVVSDVGGFAAAVYHRGIRYVSVATTLLAQVDAAIGGKTGVNLDEGKNLVGAFWQPSAVLCDTETLSTLPEREFRCGIGEVAKYHFLGPPGDALDRLAAGLSADSPVGGPTGLTGEPDGDSEDAADDAARSVIDSIDGSPAGCTDTAEKNATAPATDLRDRLDLEALVAACVRIKAAVVAADEREGGRRAILNYGHTLAHAIETANRYRAPHGEAVAVGLAYAAQLARLLGRIDDDRVADHARLLKAYGLPATLAEVGCAEVSDDDLLALFARDKKAVGGITLVLDGPDGVEPVVGIGQGVLRESLAALR